MKIQTTLIAALLCLATSSGCSTVCKFVSCQGSITTTTSVGGKTTTRTAEFNDWDEFKHPDYDAIREKLAVPVIFDGRNLYHPSTMREHGFTYYSVGRQPINP